MQSFLKTLTSACQCSLYAVSLILGPACSDAGAHPASAPPFHGCLNWCLQMWFHENPGLVGTLPESYGSLGSFPELQDFSLGNCSLSGKAICTLSAC